MTAGWDTGNASQECYTAILSPDNSNCTMKYISGTNADLWMRMNFTISQPVNQIDSITIRAIGGSNASTLASENLSFQIVNWTSNKREFWSVGSLPRKDVSITYTGASINNIIRNQELVLQFVGMNFDTTGAESFFIDYVNVQVNASNKSSQQFAYHGDGTWEVNVTAPTFASGLKDLFINASYLGNLRNNTQTNAINYGGGADITSPKYSSISVNSSSPAILDNVLFSTKWTEETALSSYIFSWNATGLGCNTWANDSIVTFIGTTNWSNVSKQIPATCLLADVNKIAWKVYANDSSNNKNNTLDTFSFSAGATNCWGYDSATKMTSIPVGCNYKAGSL
jgi:hypothetical protein